MKPDMTPDGPEVGQRRDLYAGGLLVLLGSIALWNGPSYGIGTLTNMGAGFMPTVLGVILVLLGIIIAGTKVTAMAPADRPEWRGWACILAGPILFIVAGDLGGLIPATFACVFVCALGDRTMNAARAAGLALVVTVMSVVLFHYLLHVTLPLLAWRGW